LKIREERCDVLASPMLLRQMFRLIEDIGLCINLQTDVGQPQTTGYLADSDDRRGRLVRCSQRLLTKLGAEWDAVFVQEIAQAFGHTDRAAEKNDLFAAGVRITNGLSHLFDAAMELLCGL